MFMIAAILATVANVIRQNIAIAFKKENNSLNQMAQSSSVYGPFIYTEDIPYDTMLDCKNAEQVDLASKIKSILTNEIFSSAYQLQANNVLDFLPIRKINNNEFALSTPELIGERTSKNQILKEAVEELQLMAFKRHIHEANVDITQNSPGTPTYLNLELNYINGSGDIKTVKTSIAIELIPKKVKFDALARVIQKYDASKLYRKFIKLEKKEDKFLTDFLLETKDLKSSALSNLNRDVMSYIDRSAFIHKISVEKVHPYAYAMVSELFVKDLNEGTGIDLEKDAERTKVMENLRFNGTIIYKPSTDILNVMHYGDGIARQYVVDDYVLQTSKMERELKELIRLNRG